MKQRFALSTAVGLIGGVACVVIGIVEAGQPLLFWNLPSFLIIIGGTACAMIMSFQFKDLRNLGAVIRQAFVATKYDYLEDINMIVELSTLAKKNGRLTLEVEAEKTSDTFLKKGLMMLSDNMEREDVEARLMGEIIQTQKRHRVGIAMVSKIASLAPSLGLVGTYVGLIPMLCNLQDPEALGPLMAVELVSSFYGGFLANIVFSPMAKKLTNKSDAEKHRNELILEGLMGIYDGKNPRVLQEELQVYLTKKKAAKVAKLRSTPVVKDKMKKNRRTA